jgi:hypothetical protein
MPTAAEPAKPNGHKYTSLSSLLRAENTPNRNDDPENGRSRSRERGKKEGEKKKALSTWHMMALTISMGGSQVSARKYTLTDM